MPLLEAIRVTWQYSDPELDFDHFRVYNDGQVVTDTYDTIFVDDDATLSDDFHAYTVAAVDADGNTTDPLSLTPFTTRAATLDEGRILAINRTVRHTLDYADESLTTDFLLEALQGYDFDYYSDTAATTDTYGPVQLDLVDMVGYEVLIVAPKPESMTMSVSIRLRTVSLILSPTTSRWVARLSSSDDGETRRYWTPLTTWPTHTLYRQRLSRSVPHRQQGAHTHHRADDSSTLVSDLIGAHSEHQDYPDLVWDSLATLTHSNGNDYYPYTDITGISCATYVNLTSDDAEVIYTYDSRDDNIEDEGKPVAWRYLGDDYRYVYFDIPLSAFDRATAVTVLRQAIADVRTGSTAVEEITGPGAVPGSYLLSQNYPNPFNPVTQIVYSLPQRAHVRLDIYNILGQKVRTLVNEPKAAGNYTVSWDGSDERGATVATGIYLYQMQAGEFTQSKKMLLVK